MDSYLTVISYPAKMETVFESIAFNVQRQDSQERQDAQHRFYRCQDPAQLYEIVMGAGRLLTRLDLVGHGSPTRFRLGDGDLLELGREPHPVLKQLAKELPDDIEVRVLGCLTGIGQEGLAMIQAASAALGDKTVIGTTSRVEPEHFGAEGLLNSFTATHSSRRTDIARPLPIPFTAPAIGAASGRNPYLTHLLTLDMQDVEALLHWKQFFPAGFQPLGRGQPLARPDFSLRHEGIQVTFACDCRLVLIHDVPGKPPLLMGWSSPDPVPLLPAMMQALGADGLPGLLFAPATPHPEPRGTKRSRRR
ncbi:hypothetical protein D7Y27_20160 [Corallococcus sp. AB004]|uniref:hypothetical protein n=1 Tax=Corallococcus TaxID=83461 RepID=UPI000EA29796|nr:MULTISPECIES: hypothetical protein [Corallococcus]RKI40562.1 hypothetical protein D7Y27_20160 [Corallococcus sp. AB004]NPC45939.1 hypothetical protein [Corallococcus exiguus]NRD44933.1 hypothetical protein [Corallococcus exiguus]RKH83472.1 hypothetical protein D7X99_12705 [Corallococcus sp. AB032C]RKH97078.1 hypothetical protein D7Y04_28125 [Corallococcus sp. AB038B]